MYYDLEDHEVQELSRQARDLIEHPLWPQIMAMAEEQIAREILHTAPEERERREHLYATARALETVQRLITAVVAAADEENRDHARH